MLQRKIHVIRLWLAAERCHVVGWTAWCCGSGTGADCCRVAVRKNIFCFFFFECLLSKKEVFLFKRSLFSFLLFLLFPLFIFSSVSSSLSFSFSSSSPGSGNAPIRTRTDRTMEFQSQPKVSFGMELFSTWVLSRSRPSWLTERPWVHSSSILV